MLENTKKDSNSWAARAARKTAYEHVEKIRLGSIPIEKVSLGNDVSTAREKLREIEFSESGIDILKPQPGVGKTYAIKEHLKVEDSYLIVTGSHKLLDEEYERLGAKHWEGVDKICPKITRIKKLIDLKVPIKIICQLQGCKKVECPYWRQFQTDKAAAPYHYLRTNRVYYQRGPKKGQFRFDFLVIDESLKNTTVINFDAETLLQGIETVKKYIHDSELMELLSEEIENPNFYSFDAFYSINKGTLYSHLNSALRLAIGNKNYEDVEKINKLNLYSIRESLYYRDIYGSKTYPEPLLYHVIDIARQGIPVVILDATLDEKELQIIMGRYQYEDEQIPRDTLINKDLNPLEEVKITIYTSNIIRKDLNVYRMDKDNFHFRKGYFINGKLSQEGEKTVQEIRKYIKKVLRTVSSVGIITYKELTPYFEDLGPTDYFHNLRGSNTIKDVEALFIIGTPLNSNEDIINDYNGICLTNKDPKNFYRLKYRIQDGKFQLYGPRNEEVPLKALENKKPSPLISHHTDLTERLLRFPFPFLISSYPLEDYDFNRYEDEKYQAIHRARPLIHENPPDIYIFGDVPDKIEREFEVIKLNKEETKRYFRQKFSGVTPIPLYRRITKDIDKKVEEIAKEMRLYKTRDKRNYNTRFITSMRKKVTLNDIRKIDKGIKAGLTPGEIKRKFRGLKVDKEFIEDCIYYSTEGNFVIL